MNAATRAVIERLIEALEQYAPRDRAVTQDLIAEASKLLEGDALAQPADEDALEQWARRSEALISIYVTALDEQDEDRTAAPEWAAVCDHLRTRPQQAGFVSVPVEPTPKMIDSTFDDDLNHRGESHNQRNRRIYKAMIAAATKGDGK